MVWLRQNSPFIAVSFVLGSLLVLFLVVPILGSIASSAPGLTDAITDPRTLSAIWTSFYCAFTATALMLFLGVPFAYLFVRHNFFGKRILDALIDIPILIPHNTAGIALLTILGPAYPFGDILKGLGIGFVDTAWGIVIAMAFVSAPFMVRSAQEAFLSVDPAMEKGGRSLGASKFQVFAHVTLPLALRGVLTGCLLTWARAVSEFGAVVLIAYFPRTAPVYLYDVYVGQGLAAALPINGLLILLSIVILIVFRALVAKPTKVWR
ncbi:MAG: ABC transporter permease [Candidatus Bathyarchaeota archaeon]|nr:ABC transporter permease [Candidatus Bathyarchaeota archaeon]